MREREREREREGGGGPLVLSPLRNKSKDSYYPELLNMHSHFLFLNILQNNEIHLK